MTYYGPWQSEMRARLLAGWTVNPYDGIGSGIWYTGGYMESFQSMLRKMATEGYEVVRVGSKSGLEAEALYRCNDICPDCANGMYRMPRKVPPFYACDGCGYID